MDTYHFSLLDKPTEHGFMPTMTAYILERNEDGPRPMVIVIPGGGYGMVAENWEGERIAMAYLNAGFNAAVVDYCVAPHRHPLPLMNAAAAVRICREHAGEWQADRNKIAVCGFSAGGHLAASISTLWDCEDYFSKEEIESRIYRPDASILCYPVITSGDKAHKDSFINLLGGHDETSPLWQQMSLETQVDKDTPPAFLWHTFEDDCVPVENSLLYASALKTHDVPFELHIYPKGHHGLSLTTQSLPRNRSMFQRDYGWMGLSIDWLSEVFGL